MPGRKSGNGKSRSICGEDQPACSDGGLLMDMHEKIISELEKIEQQYGVRMSRRLRTHAAARRTAKKPGIVPGQLEIIVSSVTFHTFYG